jgi:hypothetical protein
MHFVDVNLSHLIIIWSAVFESELFCYSSGKHEILSLLTMHKHCVTLYHHRRCESIVRICEEHVAVEEEKRRRTHLMVRCMGGVSVGSTRRQGRDVEGNAEDIEPIRHSATPLSAPTHDTKHPERLIPEL